MHCPAERPDQLHVPCTVAADRDEEQLQPDTAAARTCLRAALDRRGPAHLGQLLSAGCTVSLRPDSTAHLRGTLLLPAPPLALSPLFPKRLADSPLAAALVAATQPGAPPANGFLTMDAARSLLPLAAEDPQVYSVPLVGAWVRGVQGVEHPLVLAAALRFAFSSTLMDRATQPDGAFLLLIFPPGTTATSC